MFGQKTVKDKTFLILREIKSPSQYDLAMYDLAIPLSMGYLYT